MCDACYQIGRNQFLCLACVANTESPDHAALLNKVEGLEALELDDLTGKELCMECGQCIREEVAWHLGCDGWEFSEAEDCEH